MPVAGINNPMVPNTQRMRYMGALNVLGRCGQLAMGAEGTLYDEIEAVFRDACADGSLTYKAQPYGGFIIHDVPSEDRPNNYDVTDEAVATARAADKDDPLDPLLLDVTTADGKYTIRQLRNGPAGALRYGERWPAFDNTSPDNLSLALAWDLDAARDKIDGLESEIETMFEQVMEGTDMALKVTFARNFPALAEKHGCWASERLTQPLTYKGAKVGEVDFTGGITALEVDLLCPVVKRDTE